MDLDGVELKWSCPMEKSEYLGGTRSQNWSTRGNFADPSKEAIKERHEICKALRTFSGVK